MGQGIYTAVVFGSVEPPGIQVCDSAGYWDEAEWFQTLCSRLRHVDKNAVLTGYETDTKYAGVVVACSDECLCDNWHAVDFSRRVITDLNEWIAEKCGDKLASAKAAWDEIRATGRQHGADIPEGKILIVCDWD